MAASIVGPAFHLLVSVTAALAAVLLLRLPLRRLCGARLAYVFWTVIPLTILAGLLPLPHGAIARVQVKGLLPLEAQWLSQTSSSSVDVHAVLLSVWLLGFIVFLAIQLLMQYAFMRRIGPLMAQASGTWRSPAPGLTPCAVGAFRARIVVPADFQERYTTEEQELILAHERMHIDRGDPLFNLVATVLRAVLWFHPLAHLAAPRLRIDQELACDAALMAGRRGQLQVYAEAMLKSEIQIQTGPLGCGWESQTAASLERRFVMLKRTNPSHIRVFAGALLIIAVSLGIAGAAWAAQPQGKTAVETEGDSNHVNFRSFDELLGKADGKHPLLLIDGRKVSEGEARNLELSRIERIELLPTADPAAQAYGAAAADGVINFVLKK